MTETTQADRREGGRPLRDVYPEVLRRPDAKVPKTPRGERTRQKVFDAARVVFDRQGFAGSRVSDIVEGAGIALGTFYRYFHDKTDVLAALLEDVFEELYAAARAPYADADRPEAVLRQSIHRYMDVYYENRDLMRVLMEATTVDRDFAGLWFEIRGHFLVRVVRNVERAQEAGAAARMNPVLEASALGGMLENLCWVWFAMGGERMGGERLLERVDLDEMVDVATRLWISALYGEARA